MSLHNFEHTGRAMGTYCATKKLLNHDLRFMGGQTLVTITAWYNKKVAPHGVNFVKAERTRLNVQNFKHLTSNSTF